MQNREPVLAAATVTAIAAAAIALLLSFGVDISPDQQTALMGVVAVVAPLVAGLVSRRKVSPVEPPRDPNQRV